METWKSFEDAEENRSTGNHIVKEKVAHDLIDESKRTLEGSMSYIKKEVYPQVNKRCAYPSPFTVKKMTVQKIFKKEFGWEEFPTKFPNLIQFFVDRQDLNKYDWLENFFEIRNKGQHDFTEEEEKLFKVKYPVAQDQVTMVRKAAWYAAEVWIEVYKEVEAYKPKP